MASWGKVAGGRRHPPSPGGGKVGGALTRPHRRPAPYPRREERGEELDEREIFEPQYDEVNLEGDYSADASYEGYEQHAQSGHSPKQYRPGGKRHALYRWFYKILEGSNGGKRAADCVVLTVNTQTPDYAKSLGQSLQERGLTVEMICLQVESGLTRALQDIRADGSPLCILVEQTNVTLSSCTVIIFSESLKIHRNMPRDQALDFVLVEFERRQEGQPSRDPNEMAVHAAELADDFLVREKLPRYNVPADTRHLLLLLAEGVHLYSEELEALSHYLHDRQEHLQASAEMTDANAAAPLRNSLPSAMGSPPPLLPTPAIPGPPGRDRPGPPPPSGTYPKSKPPPLLSMESSLSPTHRPPGLRGPRGFTAPRGPMGHHSPHPPRGPPMSRGPPPQNGPPRLQPPSLIAHRPSGLLPSPGPLLPRPRH